MLKPVISDADVGPDAPAMLAIVITARPLTYFTHPCLFAIEHF